jgi:hypothetical protein
MKPANPKETRCHAQGRIPVIGLEIGQLLLTFTIETFEAGCTYRAVQSGRSGNAASGG